MIRFNKTKTYSLFTFVRLAIVLSINAFWDALNSLEVLQSYLGFFKVLLCSPGFSLVFLDFPAFSCVILCPPGISLVLLGSPVVSCYLLGSPGFSWVFM